jgi:hypothetical protein
MGQTHIVLYWSSPMFLLIPILFTYNNTFKSSIVIKKYLKKYSIKNLLVLYVENQGNYMPINMKKLGT